MNRRRPAAAVLWLSGVLFWTLFCVAFWFVVRAHAQDEYAYFRHNDFSGGVNYSVSSYLLADNEAADILNMKVTKVGSVEKRNGYSMHSTIEDGISASTAAISLFRYYDNAGTGKWLCHAGNKVWQYDAAGGTWSSITTGVSLRQSSWCNFLGKALFTNERDGLCSWDGTTWTAVSASGAAPYCRYIYAHNQRVYMAGRDNYPTTLYYSGLRNEALWSDISLAGANAGYWTLVTPDNSAITGFAPFQGYLAIFTNSAILALVGSYPDEQSFTTVSSQVGCTAPRSIVRVGDSAAFKYLNHVYILNSPPAKISTKLGEQMSACTNSVAVVYKDELFVTDPGTNNFMADTEPVYVYDTQFQRWVVYDDMPAGAFGVASANGDDEFLISDAATDRVWKWNTSVFTDAVNRNSRSYVSYSGQYTGYVYTKRWTLGAPETPKKFRALQVDLYGTSGDLRVDYDIDYSRAVGNTTTSYTMGGRLDSFVIGTDIVGGQSGAIDIVAFKPDDAGRNIQFKFSNDRVNDQIQLLGMALRFRPTRFRGEE
jgi:hypothetical protein